MAGDKNLEIGGHDPRSEAQKRLDRVGEGYYDRYGTDKDYFMALDKHILEFGTTDGFEGFEVD